MLYFVYFGVIETVFEWELRTGSDYQKGPAKRRGAVV